MEYDRKYYIENCDVEELANIIMDQKQVIRDQEELKRKCAACSMEYNRKIHNFESEMCNLERTLDEFKVRNKTLESIYQNDCITKKQMCVTIDQLVDRMADTRKALMDIDK